MSYEFEKEGDQSYANLCMRLRGQDYASFHPNADDPGLPEHLTGIQTAIIMSGYPVMVLRGDHRATLEHVANTTDCDCEAIAKVYHDRPELQMKDYEAVTGDQMIMDQLLDIALGLSDPRWED